MNIFLILFFYIEFFNILSALITRLCMLGKPEKIYEEQNNDSNKLAFCIAGLLNQPERAFKHIDIPGYKKVYVKFSPFGYSGVTLGKIINALHQINVQHHYEDIVLGISIGSLAALNAKTDQTILINPCCNAKMLKKSLYWLIKIFSPIAEIISLALGWLSFIPIIPAQEGRYSLTLLVDQLFNMGYGSILNKLPTQSKVIVKTNGQYFTNSSSAGQSTQTGVIVSDKDEFLNNEEIINYFEKNDPLCSIVSIDTMHARIGDPKDAPKYQAAINYFLKNQE